MRNCSTKMTPFIYSFGLKISRKTDRFYCAATRLAEYFEVHRTAAAKAMRELTALGFFEVVEQEKFKPTVYRVLTHAEWAEENPDQCCEKIVLDFLDIDSTGALLHSLSGGRIKYKAYQVQALRNAAPGMCDDSILCEWQYFLSSPDRPAWPRCHMAFLRYLATYTKKAAACV